MTSPQLHNLIQAGFDLLDLNEENYRKNKQELFSYLKPLEPEWIWISANSRRKIILQINSKNEVGFFAQKTNQLIAIDSCFIAEKEIDNFISHLKKFLKNQQQNFFTKVSITLFDNGLDVIFYVKKTPDLIQERKLIQFAKEQNINVSYNIQDQIIPVLQIRKNQIFYPDFKIDLDSDIFIQATKSGLYAIIEICRKEILQLKNAPKIIDLYSGFGAYSFGIYDLASKIKAIEESDKMTNLIGQNTIKNGQNKISTQTRDLFLDPVNKNELKEFDLAIINPPRNGASPQILEIAKSSLKNLIYVTCNPQSFLRDFEILKKENFTFKKLYALDQFYGTKHLELVAILENQARFN